MLKLKPIGTDTGIQDNSTAINRGEVVVFNAVADSSKVVRAAGANATKLAGIAVYDCAGQNKDFLYVYEGKCPGKLGGTVTQGDPLVTDANGKLVTGSGTGRNVVGYAEESGVSGDLIPVRLAIGLTDV